MSIDIDIENGAWSSKTPMEIARSHSPVAVYQGKLYVFGGGGPNFASLNAVSVYDPSTNAWDRRCDMPTHRSGTVHAIVNDRIYIMGGGFKQENGMFRFLTKVEIYDPASDSWESGPDLLMPHDYPSVALLDNHIYVMGGHHPDATKAGPKTDPGFDFCERLDLRTGQWEQIAPLPTPRFALSAVVWEEKILTLGGVAFSKAGFNNYDFVEVYDPGSGEWSRSQDITLPWPAAGLGSCTFGNNILIFGGYSGEGIHHRAALYQAGQKAWRQLPAMPIPLAAMGVATLDASIYLIGGWADDGRTPLNTVFSYDCPDSGR